MTEKYIDIITIKNYNCNILTNIWKIYIFLSEFCFYHCYMPEIIFLTESTSLLSDSVGLFVNYENSMNIEKRGMIDERTNFATETV